MVKGLWPSLLMLVLVAPAVATPVGTAEVALAQEKGLPHPFLGGAAVWTGREALVLGGYVHSDVVRGTEDPDAATTSAVVRFVPGGTPSVLPTRLPRPSAAMGAVWTGDAVLLFGGDLDYHHTYDAIVRYDPAAGAVRTMSARLPSPRDWVSAAWDPAKSVDCPAGCAYVFGGGSWPHIYSEIIRYDPVGDRATVDSARLPTGRWGTASFWDARTTASCPHGCGYIVGGFDQKDNLADILRFDPSSHAVTKVAQLPVKRADLAIAWTGEKALLMGGHINTPRTYLPDAYVFDPKDSSVQPACTVLGIGRGYPAGVWTGKEAYLFGGATPGHEPTSDVVRVAATAACIPDLAALADTLPPLPVALHLAAGEKTRVLSAVGSAIVYEAGAASDVLATLHVAADPSQLPDPVPPMPGKEVQYLQVESEEVPKDRPIRIELPAPTPDKGVVPAVNYFDGEAWVDLAQVKSGVVHGQAGENDLRVYDAGYDASTGKAWAIVDHASTYAVGGQAPAQEDGTRAASAALMPLALAALAAAVARRRA